MMEHSHDEIQRHPWLAYEVGDHFDRGLRGIWTLIEIGDHRQTMLIESEDGEREDWTACEMVKYMTHIAQK